MTCSPTYSGHSSRATATVTVFITVWPWPLTDWPPGQCMPNDCIQYTCIPSFGVDSSSHFPFTDATIPLIPPLANKIWKFLKSNMAAAAILKNRNTAITPQRIDRFWRILARWCNWTLWISSANNIWAFLKSKMASLKRYHFTRRMLRILRQSTCNAFEEPPWKYYHF